jgi:hypothetical protein
VKVTDFKNYKDQITRKTDGSNSACYAALSALLPDASILLSSSLSRNDA